MSKYVKIMEEDHEKSIKISFPSDFVQKILVDSKPQGLQLRKKNNNLPNSCPTLTSGPATGTPSAQELGRLKRFLGDLLVRDCLLPECTIDLTGKRGDSTIKHADFNDRMVDFTMKKYETYGDLIRK